MAKRNNKKLSISVPGQPTTKRLRSPDWRYTYVKNLIDSWSKPRPDDDKYVVALYNYMNILRHGKADEIETYKDANPDMADAFFMYENGVMYRIDVDTRFVARFTFEEIANIVGRPVPVIEHYIYCFFDVFDHLDNPGYLNRWVLEPIMRAAPFSTESMWKRVAIYGGKEMLLNLEKCTPHQTQKLHETLFDNLLLSKGIQAINGITPNAKNAIDIILAAQNHLNEKRKLAAFTTNPDSDDNVVTQLVSVMMKSFIYTTVTDGLTPADPLRANPIDTTYTNADAPRFPDGTSNK